MLDNKEPLDKHVSEQLPLIILVWTQWPVEVGPFHELPTHFGGLTPERLLVWFPAHWVILSILTLYIYLFVRNLSTTFNRHFSNPLTWNAKNWHGTELNTFGTLLLALFCSKPCAKGKQRIRYKLKSKASYFSSRKPHLSSFYSFKVTSFLGRQAGRRAARGVALEAPPSWLPEATASFVLGAARCAGCHFQDISILYKIRREHFYWFRNRF